MSSEMDLLELMTSRIDQIMDSVGPGMKVLLMDEDTTTSVSVSCPQSRIMKKEVFLFEILHDRLKDNSNLSYLKCVVLIKPTSENLRLLSREIATPRYGSYFIFFTNKVKRTDLKSLAEADGNEVVTDLKEVPSDFLVFESHVFTTKVQRPILNQDWNKTSGSLQKCIDSLKSLILALKGTRANICHMKDSHLCERLREGVKDEINHEGSRDTMLVILDRRMDPVTPLLNQWTYQAMIHELIGIKNNTVDLSGRNVPDEMRKMTLSADTDEFYKLNMYANFGQLGQTVQSLVKDYQEMKNKKGNLDSLNDLKDFIADYPEFKKMSGTVDKHVTLMTELSNEHSGHNLFEVSEFEQSIACGEDKDNSITQLVKILKSPKIRQKDALRLISLYTIRYGQDVQNHLSTLCKSVQNMAQKEVYDVIQLVNKYSNLLRLVTLMANLTTSQSKSKLLFDDKPLTAANFFRGLKGAENVYTQHEPLITKELLPDIIRGRQRTDLTYLRTPVEVPNKVIIYVIGGLTYEESRAVAMFNKDHGSNVIIGGTAILNFDSFMESMQETCPINK